MPTATPCSTPPADIELGPGDRLVLPPSAPTVRGAAKRPATVTSAEPGTHPARSRPGMLTVRQAWGAGSAGLPDAAGHGRRQAVPLHLLIPAVVGQRAGLVAGYRGRGWAVVANAATLTPSKDPEVLAVEGDIADPAAAGRVIGGALDRFGRLDTLVNNAGAFISKPFTDYTAADYATVVGVNLAGFFCVTQRAIAEMATRYGGHVVTVTATLGGAADSGAPAALAALTKGGLAAATRSLALEYAAYGIRVNAVSPGIIQAPDHPADSYQHLGGRLPPLGRAGQVSAVVDGVLFLESSSYITGEILHIDGGQIAGY